MTEQDNIQTDKTGQPERRPVYRHTSHSIDGKHRVNDLSILVSNLVGGTARLIYIVFAVLGIALFFRHWYTTTSIGHEPISSLQKMSCSKFNSLGRGDQQTVATRLFVASGDANENVINNEMGSANALLNIQYSCQSNPGGTVSE